MGTGLAARKAVSRELGGMGAPSAGYDGFAEMSRASGFNPSGGGGSFSMPSASDAAGSIVGMGLNYAIPGAGTAFGAVRSMGPALNIANRAQAAGIYGPDNTFAELEGDGSGGRPRGYTTVANAAQGVQQAAAMPQSGGLLSQWNRGPGWMWVFGA